MVNWLPLKVETANAVACCSNFSKASLVASSAIVRLADVHKDLLFRSRSQRHSHCSTGAHSLRSFVYVFFPAKKHAAARENCFDDIGSRIFHGRAVRVNKFVYQREYGNLRDDAGGIGINSARWLS